MAIKNSEVYRAYTNPPYANEGAIRAGKKYFRMSDQPYDYVLNVNDFTCKNKVCFVCEMIDDTDPFPPLPSELTSDTPRDRAFDAAMRDAKKA